MLVPEFGVSVGTGGLESGCPLGVRLPWSSERVMVTVCVEVFVGSVLVALHPTMSVTATSPGSAQRFIASAYSRCGVLAGNCIELRAQLRFFAENRAPMVNLARSLSIWS